MKGFIVDACPTSMNDEEYVDLFGKLESGESFVARQKLTPYFFIEEKNEKKAEKLLKKYTIEKTDLKTFKGEKVIKISTALTADLNRLSTHLHELEIPTYEADIRPYFRYCMDNNLLGSIEISGDYQMAERVNKAYLNADIKSSSYKPELNILSIDIETDKHAGNLFCIGLYGNNYSKTFFVGTKKMKNAQVYETEEECLEEFKKELIKRDPDIITGWNLIDFDLDFLNKKFAKYKISSDLGRDNSNMKLRIESNFMRDSSCTIRGRQVLDGLNLIGDPFIKEAPMIKKLHFESLTLEDVSQAILGEGKLIKGKERHNKIEELYTQDPQALVEYNMQDCKLVYDLIKKTDIVTLAVERSSYTGMPLDRITSSIAAFDSLYIRTARQQGFVSPTNVFRRKEERIKGGFVKESKSGIYHNVIVLDFKSLYPSIIKTFNIDPASQLDKAEKGAIVSPNKAYFKNTEGILPEIIQKLHLERERAKKEKRELASYALKITMNSFFGVLASPNCRYFNLDMANAITSFGREIIQQTAAHVEKQKHEVIYSDTDSVFLKAETTGKAAEKLGLEIQDDVNNFYKDYVKKEYNRTSFLELEYEKHYKAFMIPAVRGTETGAKKRYAGLLSTDELEIVGLEAIRGDWTEAAQIFQRELLMRAFQKEPIEQFIKTFIKDILAGKYDARLVYRKSIRKDLDKYTKITPPHVKAARQLDSLEGNLIQYYITTEGPEPIQKLKHPLDYDHYIKKQIEPIANQVLGLLGKSMDDIVKGSTQKKLF
jgi:DNA polymerase-2